MELNSTLASRLYENIQSALRTGEASRPKQTDLAMNQAMAETAESFVDTLRVAEETAKSGMIGRADPHSVVAALASAEMAVHTAVTVRDKVVEAYQEILRMPV